MLARIGIMRSEELLERFEGGGFGRGRAAAALGVASGPRSTGSSDGRFGSVAAKSR
jgi:hypothetical protein